MIRFRATKIDVSALHFVALIVAASAVATGCDMPGKPNPADRPVAASAVVNFDILYGVNCAGCHGADGSHGPAPPLNDQLFLAIVPDEVLTNVIRHGRPDTPMPAFAADHGGTLTDEQVQALAAGLKAKWLENKKSEGAEPPPYLAGRELIVGESNQPSPGVEVFAQACAGCHGENGKGDSAGAVNNVAFLTLVSDQALRRLIITGRPDLGMPTFAGDDGRDAGFKPLTSRQVTALVALLADWRVASPPDSRHAALTGEASPGAKQ